jgi:hypothetical protein
MAIVSHTRRLRSRGFVSDRGNVRERLPRTFRFLCFAVSRKAVVSAVQRESTAGALLRHVSTYSESPGKTRFFFYKGFQSGSFRSV